MGDRVLVVCEDLFLFSKIQTAAAALGRPIERVRDEAAMQEAWQGGGVRRVIVDLGTRAVDPFAWGTRWKTHASPPELVAFASHVDREAQQRARAAGYDQVLPKSQLFGNLPKFL